MYLSINDFFFFFFLFPVGKSMSFGDELSTVEGFCEDIRPHDFSGAPHNNEIATLNTLCHPEMTNVNVSATL